MNILQIIHHFLRYLFWLATAKISRHSGYIQHKQADIYYLVYGSGRPVVLLHGGLSNKLSWFSQVPFLVNNGYQVILLDTRGHGRSTLGSEKLSYDLFAEDLGKVLDKLAIHQTDIIGWSDGGITALVFGHQTPERVRRMIAISANISPQGFTKKARRQIREKLGAASFWVQSKWTGSERYFDKLNKIVRHIWLSPVLDKTHLNQINSPTLIVVGEYDMITVEHSAEMAELISQGQLIVIKGGGHSTPVTHALQINQYIADFLDNDEADLRNNHD